MRISALNMLSRLRSSNRRNNGTMFAILGIIIITRIAFRGVRDSGIRNRANNYAPVRASVIINAVEKTEMTTLLASVGVMASSGKHYLTNILGVWRDFSL